MSIRELARTVDERLADLSWADYTFAVERGIIKDTIRRYAGQKCDWRTREWDGTFEDALYATPESWDAARFEQAKAAYAKNLVTSLQIDIEIDELAACYRDYYWNRAFLVKASNGHVHKSQDCSTCFPTTEFAWLPQLSGADETEIVEAAGETACTVCYPSAPAEVLNRPTTIVTADKVAKEAAKAEREAKRLERDAKRLAKAATKSGEPLIVPDDYWADKVTYIDTEYTARREWNSAEDSKGWIAERQPERAARYAERQRLIEGALAEKHGLSVEEMRAELQAKFAKRKR
jgi:hypothetical protein